MTPRDRTLKRLLRQPALRTLLAERPKAGDLAITDSEGAVLIGEAATGPGSAILLDGREIGRVHGPHAEETARLVAALAIQDQQTRALAQESLDRYRELTMLSGISEKLLRAPDAQAVAAIVAEEARRYVKGDRAAVLLINPETGRLEIAANDGAAFHDRTTMEAGEDVLGTVLQSGSGEIVNDLESDRRAPATALPIRSLVCSPLKARDRIFGLLVVGSATGTEFVAGDLQILNAVSSQAAAALEATRLRRALKSAERKPVDLIYGVGDRPPLGITFLLGIQHVLIAIMSLAYPVLVTLEAGGDRADAASMVAVTLVAMAVATVLQTLRAGPVGSGYLAPYIASAIYLGPSLLAARQGGLGLVLGMTALSGVVAVALSQVLRRFRRLFPPEVSGVVVLMVGLSMVPVALSRTLGLDGEDTVTDPEELAVGLLTLATIVGLTALRRGRLRLYATAIGLGLGYVGAAGLGLFDPGALAEVADLPIIGLPALPAAYPEIDLLLFIPFAAAALAASIKDAGLLISCQRTNDPAWRRPDTASLGGGLVAGGLGTAAAGVLGGLGLGISAGSVGLAAATGSTARVIGLASAAIFLALALLPQATAMLSLVPLPVMGAGLIYVACHLVASGIDLMASRMLDARRIYVIGIPLLVGVGLIASPEFSADAPDWAGAVLASPLAVSTLLVLLLNACLNLGVATRAVLDVSTGPGFAERAIRFTERQGAAWGAREDVVRLVAPAIVELGEEIAAVSGPSDLTVTLAFDEVSLTASIVRRTRALETGLGLPSAPEDAVEAIAKRYGATTRRRADGTATLRFEH